LKRKLRGVLENRKKVGKEFSGRIKGGCLESLYQALED
jgi:hypothetical protein